MRGSEAKDDSGSKVVFEGMSVAEDESKEDVVSKVNEVSKDETPYLWIEVESDFVGLDKPAGDVSKAEADALLVEQRRLFREYHTKNNRIMAEELNLDGMDVKYSCGVYTPFISAEFNKDITEKDLEQIYKVAKHKSVKKVYVRGKQHKESELSDTIRTVGAEQILNNDPNAGEGIVVGILEVNGTANVNNFALKDANMIVQDQFWNVETISDHANQMAIIVHKIAPGATILCSQLFGDFTDEIDWMLYNDVNVINMSFSIGDADEHGDYTSLSAYCDYAVRNAWVTIVGSAGNQRGGNIYITQPNGYNMVTVGASIANCNGVWSSSSYEERYDTDKPNIVAVGTDYLIPTYTETVDGTSCATALTSGAVAVLMQKDTSLKYQPESVLSLLMASAQRIERYAISYGFDEKAGTGALNLANAVSALGNTVRFSRSYDSVGDYVSSRSVYLSKGQTVRVAFTSLINSEGDAVTDLVTDYDLYLINSSGKLVASCAKTHNCEFIEYQASESGIYTIKIKQYSAKKTDGADCCAYTYFIR